MTSNGYLTWRQKVLLRAAMAVDYLPFRAALQANIPTGVYRSLVRRGYLRKHPKGWVITPEGRALNPWWAEEDRKALILEQMRKAS